MNIINRIPRSVVGVVLGATLIVAPMAVFANNSGKSSYDRDDVKKTGTELSVTITDSGKTTVRGAKVTAVSGSTITATTAFGSTTLTWTINTSGSTQFVDKGGKNAVASTVVAGDVISFAGMLEANASSLTVQASQVKNWSKNSQVLTKHTFDGTLVTAPGTTTLPTSFTLKVGGTNYTVNVPLNTPVLNKVWASITIGQLQVNDNVRVYGSVTADNLTNIQAVVVRDASR